MRRRRLMAAAGLLAVTTAGAAAADEPRSGRPAYQVNAAIDVPVLAVALAFVAGRGLRGGLAPAYCAPTAADPLAASTFCDPSGLNWLDRKVAGRYQPGWNKWSDVGLYGIQGLAAGSLLLHEGPRNGLNDLVVVAEATLVASAASGLSTSVTGRPRPFMYGAEAPPSVRQGGDGALSYFSGHTSTTFGCAVSTFMTFHRLHPADRWPWFVLGAGVASGTLVASARVLGGNHFPTDVAVGAMVGAAIGVAIPALHDGPHPIVVAPMPVADRGGLVVTTLLP